MVSAASLRVVFFGTPQFAVPTLDAILRSRHTVVGVVTQPDRPRGRGQKTADSPVKARARQAGLAVLQPTTMRDPSVVDTLRRLDAEIAVVAAYGKLLTEAVIEVPRLGTINVHASLLPRYRGAAPVHRAVIAGEPETGVTIMRIVKALDAGPMLASVRRRVSDDETSEDVERDLASLGADLLVSTLDRLAEGPVVEEPQDDRQATYASRLTREDGMVDWNASAHAIHNRIRGLHPWPRASAFLDGLRLILWRSTWADGAAHPLPGVVLAAQGDALRVATGAGILSITSLQTEGKRPMTARDFLTGHAVAPGQRFTVHP